VKCLRAVVLLVSLLLLWTGLSAPANAAPDSSHGTDSSAQADTGNDSAQVTKKKKKKKKAKCKKAKKGKKKKAKCKKKPAAPKPSGPQPQVSIAAGGNHTCMVKTNGTLWCWGGNGFGQLGDGTTTDKAVPTQIGTDTNWKVVSAVLHGTCAIKTNGTLWCWGKTTPDSSAMVDMPIKRRPHRSPVLQMCWESIPVPRTPAP
jgi:hypothetical protein